MADHITVVPAYGRDYATSQEALADWKAGKDFRICDISCRWNGAYISVRDKREVKIRFNRLQDFVLTEHSDFHAAMLED